MDLIQRAKNICLTPQTEWPVIAEENTPTAELITGYVLPLATVGAVAGLIGGSVVGQTLPFVGTYRTPLATGLGVAILAVVMAVIACFVISAVINALAPTFGATKNSTQALKVAVYSFTPGWIAGVFQILPVLGVLGLLGALYGMYLLYLGLPSRFCCNFGPATSGWTVFDNDWTGSPIMPSDNPFKWRQFEPGLILLCVRWYLRYAVSYRDLEEMMRERGLCVDHTTIYRWVQRYAPEIDKRCRPFLRRTTDSYRIDETYVRVGGAWHYLYRGVDSNGDTLDFLLRATRDRNAAIAFFRKTVGASHTTPPRVVNVDKNPAYPIAVEAIKHEGFFRPRSSLRQCKYLNNVIEQDHRFIKRRTRPMLGFKRFTTAWRTVRGIEIMHALRKGQARWMAKGDVVGQTRLIHKVFGLAV